MHNEHKGNKEDSLNNSREHALINELINLMCKGGCEAFVGNFQRDATVLAPRREWTSTEINEAVNYVRYMNEYFGKPEAVAVITSLISKFHISVDDLTIPHSPSEKVGLES
jgi:hypothetical protein